MIECRTPNEIYTCLNLSFKYGNIKDFFKYIDTEIINKN